MSTPMQAAFLKMCRKRGINPEGQFAQEDGYLFYDGYEAGVRDTHKLCDIEGTVVSVHKLLKVQAAALAVLSDALDDAESAVHVCDAQNDDIKVRRLSESLQKLYQVLKNDPE